MQKQFITRIAPSPTGIMHLGTARTAYFNWLAARASNGKFILRIDDTDNNRNDEKYTQIILDGLDWLGLDYDEIYYQSKRVKLYQSEAKGLISKGKAKELNNGAVALLLTCDLPSYFYDSISGNIPITDTNKEQIHEKVILLKGIHKDKDGKNVDERGQPTYQLASTIDDYFICGRSKFDTWIIRGVDHITNTPKQLAIWCALNEMYSPMGVAPLSYPLFTHLGLINRPITDDTECKVRYKKLSKRDGSIASLMDYKEQGYCPEAILNFLLRLGWAPKGDNKEHTYIPKDWAVELFLSGNFRNSPANYDLNKLNAFQKHYAKSY